MTEQDAKTKACHRTFNECDHPKGANYSMCIGSACMAWRWEGVIMRDSTLGAETYVSREPSMIREAVAGKSDNRRVGLIGFCGLAGKP